MYIHRDLCLCTSFLVRIAGGGAAPSPLHPPTRFYFLIDFPCYLLSFVFFHMYRFFGFIFSVFLNLYLYPSRLEPVCFFLGTHCGGRRCALLSAPPHPLLIFHQLPLLPTLFLFFAIIVYLRLFFIEGSLEVKLPTIWRDEKQSRAEAERRGRLAERRSEEKE